MTKENLFWIGSGINSRNNIYFEQRFIGTKEQIYKRLIKFGAIPASIKIIHDYYSKPRG